MNGDNDEGIRDRKLIHTSWRGMGAPSVCGHTSGHPCLFIDHRGLLIIHTSQESSNRDKPDWEGKKP